MLQWGDERRGLKREGNTIKKKKKGGGEETLRMTGVLCTERSAESAEVRRYEALVVRDRERR